MKMHNYETKKNADVDAAKKAKEGGAKRKSDDEAAQKKGEDDGAAKKAETQRQADLNKDMAQPFYMLQQSWCSI